MNKILVGLLALVGCATTLPARPCNHRYTDVSLTAPGWAQNFTENRATVVILVHNPRASLVEAHLDCGLPGQVKRTVVRVPAGLEQEVHFSVDRKQASGNFSCEVAAVESFHEGN